MEAIEGTITIPISEYNQLMAASEELDRLHANGVDNWEGYEEE